MLSVLSQLCCRHTTGIEDVVGAVVLVVQVIGWLLVHPVGGVGRVGVGGMAMLVVSEV